MYIYLAYIPTILLLLALILLIHVRDRNNPKHIIFLMILVPQTLWLILLFLTDAASELETSMLFLRIAHLFVGFMFTGLYVMSSKIYTQDNLSRKDLLTYFAVGTLIGLFGAHPLSIMSIYYDSNGVVSIDSYGMGYLAFMLSILTTFIASLIRLFWGYTKSNPAIKRRVRLFCSGLVTSFGIGLALVIIPDLLSLDVHLDLFGIALSNIVFALFLLLSIISRGFFSLSADTVKTTFYFFSILAVVCLTTVAIVITAYLNSLVLILSFIVGVTLWSLKSKFDAMTNRIFFQDKSELQTILDELSNIFISERKLKPLLKKSEKILSGALKSSKLKIITVDNVKDKGFEDVIRSVGPQAYVKASALEQATKLYQEMTSKNIEFIKTVRNASVVYAYILIGPKQTGTAYSNVDIELMEIASKNLAIAIQRSEHYEQSSRLNVKLKESIDAAKKRLVNANLELYELNETRDEFIGLASHQLRTPLTALNSYTSFALNEKFGPVTKKQVTILEQIGQSTSKMIHSVTELLETSRIETGTFEPVYEKVNLSKLLEAKVRETNKTHPVIIIEQELQPKVFISSDSTRLETILSELLINAVKHGQNLMSVKLVSSKELAIITISNNGSTFKEKEKVKIFEKFYRSKKAIQQNPEGTGVGLYLVKNIVEKLNGSISTQSNGEKTEFEVVIPLGEIA